ncbi:MAG: PAS domain S-box protein [Syntrophaceae bacterium]
MKDTHKTKKQLVKELEEMRRQLAACTIERSEHRRGAEELFDEKNKLQSIIEAMASGITIQDLDYNIIYQNELLKKNFGERLGEKCYAVYEGKDRVCDGCPVEMAYRDGKAHTEKRRVIMPSGEVTFWENTANAIRDASGEIVSCLEIARNITERFRAEEALRKSEEKYRSLASTADSMYLVDRECRYLFMNERHLERLSLPSDQIIGKIYGDVHSEKDSTEFTRYVEHVFNTGTFIQHEHKSERDDRYFLRTFSPVKDQEGKTTVAVTVVSKDITDRKFAEEALRESEQRLHSIIQGSPIPAFVVGKDHKVLYWNKAIEELSGIKAEEVVGTKHQWMAFYSDERPCMADLLVEQALDAIPKWYFEKYTKSKLIEEAYEATDFFPAMGENGKWLRFTAAVIRDSQGTLVGVIETLEDITERKRAEEELIRVKKLESLGIFADGLAHDFNNLLSVMLRNIFAVKLSFADEKEELVEGLEIAEKVGLQAKELAHRLITFAKGGKPIIKIGSMLQLLKDSVDLSLSGSNVRSELSLPNDLWPVIMDDVQIRQVIHNLVINAREAMPDGGIISICAENVTISAGDDLPLKEGTYLKWSVKDHGVGINKEVLPKIFDPYFTTKPTGSARGMGLGLAICYSIIKKHDGFITVESEPGVGSTFIVYLPASPPHEDPETKAGMEKRAAGGGKILVMDDEETVRNATGIILNYLGCEVEFAQDGREAIHLYKKAKEKGDPFSAVILDLYVPGGMGAKETMRELYAMDPYVKAIISCGYIDDPVISEFSKYSYCWTIEVPYDIDKMKALLSNLLK